MKRCTVILILATACTRGVPSDYKTCEERLSACEVKIDALKHAVVDYMANVEELQKECR